MSAGLIESIVEVVLALPLDAASTYEAAVSYTSSALLATLRTAFPELDLAIKACETASVITKFSCEAKARQLAYDAVDSLLKATGLDVWLMSILGMLDQLPPGMRDVVSLFVKKVKEVAIVVKDFVTGDWIAAYNAAVAISAKDIAMAKARMAALLARARAGEFDPAWTLVIINLAYLTGKLPNSLSFGDMAQAIWDNFASLKELPAMTAEQLTAVGNLVISGVQQGLDPVAALAQGDVGGALLSLIGGAEGAIGGFINFLGGLLDW